MTTPQLLSSVGFSSQLLQIDNAVHYTSIFVHDPIQSQRIRQFTESVAKAHKEEVIAKLDVEELQMDEKWVIVLTDKALYKFSLDGPLTQPRKRKPLNEFFDVAADLSNPRSFTTLLYKDNLKTSIKASWNRLAGRAGASIELASLLQRREYICQSELQRDQFVWAFNAVLKHEWQSFLETKIIPAPEIYQRHQLVVKQNKRGSNQERLLAVSTQCIYNIELTHNPTSAEMKWWLPVQCLHAVSLEENARLDFFFDADEIQSYTTQLSKNKIKLRSNMLDKSKLNETYQFLFPDDKSRADFVSVLQHIYKSLLTDQGRPSELKVLVNTTLSLQTSHQSSYTQVGNKSNVGSPLVGAQSSLATDMSSPLIRRGSNLDDLIQQHRQMVQNAESNIATELLCESLEKMTHGKATKSHPKVFSLSSDLTIRWGDSPSKFKYTAKVISVIKAQDMLEQLPPEQRPNFFALRTTEKPLYLLARDAGSAATWKATVEAYSGASQIQVVEGINSSQQEERQQAELVKMQLTVPVINGWLEKAIAKSSGTGGFEKTHQRYFAIHADGTINWGNAAKLKHSSTIVDVDQDISAYPNLPHSQGLRFIRITTTTKTLELLCPSQESAERWYSIASKIINPDADLGEESDDDDAVVVDQNFSRQQFFDPGSGSAQEEDFDSDDDFTAY